tara:strand:- start:9973 stop:10848 length:876 start_codon:yes stop_codon:yes gene_type:complete
MILSKHTKIVVINVLLTPVFLFSQNISREDYIKSYKKSAITQMEKYKIPASITLAQGILESNNGNSFIATEGKNHFGIKCHDWKGEKVYADDDIKNECFRKYKNVSQSFEDHSLFLMKNQRYKFLFDLKITDYKSWSKGLKKAGYATNPRYSEILIRLIEDNKLYSLDKLKDSKSVNNKLLSRKIFMHPNRIKYIICEKDESLADISRKLDIRLWQIYKYNEINKGYEVKEGDKIFIQPKRNKSNVKTHIIEKGETLRSISQKYGVKIKKIKKKNKTVDIPLKEGDTIILK